jgi:hypothetical protein
VLDQSDVSSQTAEPSSPSTDTTPGPVAQPSEPPRRELASLDEALRQTSGRPKQTTANGAERGRRNGSGQQGQSASALNSPRPAQSAGPESEPDQAVASGDSAQASTSGDDQADDTDDATTPERPSRRERAEVKRLAAERDQIAAERDQLRQHLTVSPEVYQAAIASRLPDDEFQRLAIKKQREDLTGDYLSADEANKLGQAIQVREWSLPWYLDAQKQVSQWSQAEWTRIQHDQAKAISTVMRNREYIKPDAIARAGSWDQILEHFAESSFQAGAASKQADLDDLKSELADLKAELSGSRVGRAASGRALERGGSSGRAFAGAPDYKTSSAGDLFEAAMRQKAEQARRRSRRTG